MKIYRIARYNLTIEEIANNERKKAIKQYSENGLANKCLHISKSLKNAISANGYELANVVRGLLQLDKPVEMPKNWNKNDFNSEEEAQKSLFQVLHYWVEIDNKVVDITATQFNDKMNTKFNPVVIGTYGSLNRYIPIDRDWI